MSTPEENRKKLDTAVNVGCLLGLCFLAGLKLCESLAPQSPPSPDQNVSPAGITSSIGPDLHDCRIVPPGGSVLGVIEDNLPPNTIITIREPNGKQMSDALGKLYKPGHPAGIVPPGTQVCIEK